MSETKHINIIARSNGVGLDSDALLLNKALTKAGYKVTFSHCRSRSILQKLFSKKTIYDINIYLERVFPNWLNTAPVNILIPNQERFPKRHIDRLKHIDSVFCKSKHAQEIFNKLGANSHFISFTSKDINLNDRNPDYSKFFHLAGSSTLKGTETILRLWENHPEWPNLTLLQHQHNAPDKVPNNVTLITEHLSEPELYHLANTKGIHLCTSLSEGWGHYIVEAMSSHALVITTDAPPMNELITPDRGITVAVSHSEPRHLGTNFFIDEQQLEKVIDNVIKMPDRDKSIIGQKARDWYQNNDVLFQNNIVEALKAIF